MNEQELISLSPLARQFATRKLAVFMEKSNGSDLHFLVEAIRIILSDISTRDEVELSLSDKENKLLRLVDVESAKINSYLEDTDIDKLDITHPKFISYQNALLNITCIQDEVFKIAFNIISKTNLIHISISHTYLAQERANERNLDLSREDDDEKEEVS